MTEIQVSATSNPKKISKLHNRQDKFQSIAVYSKKDIVMVSHTRLCTAWYHILDCVLHPVLHLLNHL